MSVLVLGDSYSAGNGGGDYSGPPGCWRSAHNYAAAFEQTLEAPPYNRSVSVQNRSCSGATTAAFWSPFNHQAPQLNSVSTSDDLIFLTSGGDDVHFADIAKFCLIEPFLVGNHCLANLDRAESEIAGDGLARRLTGVLTAIRQRSGKHTKIVLVGYPLLIANRDFTLVDRREGRHSDAGLACGERRGTTNLVTVGACLVAIGHDGDRLEQNVVDALNHSTPGQPLVFVSTQRLFAGPPDHSLTAPIGKTTAPQPNRWFVQPYDDSSVVEHALWYHPNRSGWDAEGRLLARVVKGRQTTFGPRQVSVTITGSGDGQSFEAKVGDRPFPQDLGDAVDLFGSPSERKLTGAYGKDCVVRWSGLDVSASFTTEYGGTRNDGCTNSSGTQLVTFGSGWSTSAGLDVGASAAAVDHLYPHARTLDEGRISLLSYFSPGANQELTELGADTANGRITDLTVAGIPDE